MHTIDQKVLTTTLATATLIGAMYWQAQDPAMPRTNFVSEFVSEQEVAQPPFLTEPQEPEQNDASLDVASNLDSNSYTDYLYNQDKYQTESADPS